MKVIAIICLLSVAFYSCGSTTSSTSYRSSYEIGPLPSASEYRERQILAAVVAIAGTAFLIWLIYQGKEGQTAIMKSWEGAHISRLIRSWGPPQEIVSDGAGGRIYIYS